MGFPQGSGNPRGQEGGMPDSDSRRIPLTVLQGVDQQHKAEDMRRGGDHGLSPHLERQGLAWDGIWEPKSKCCGENTSGGERETRMVPGSGGAKGQVRMWTFPRQGALPKEHI